ncbi:hypothetical protein Tco_0063965 [Tanacetum coccineum]|uniref:Uncharacterized protein n=1 Tax=Tanacetum coccineum TaxID=301880 RepID=A0ABQ4Z2M1_9ASTR
MVIKLKRLWKNKKVECSDCNSQQSRELLLKVYAQEEGIIFGIICSSARWKLCSDFIAHAAHKSFPIYQYGRENGMFYGSLEGRGLRCSAQRTYASSMLLCTLSKNDQLQKHIKEVIKNLLKYLKGSINGTLGISSLVDKLVSWMSKKQNCTAMSSAEASALPEDRFKYLVRRIGYGEVGLQWKLDGSDTMSSLSDTLKYSHDEWKSFQCNLSSTATFAVGFKRWSTQTQSIQMLNLQAKPSRKLKIENTKTSANSDLKLSR